MGELASSDEMLERCIYGERSVALMQKHVALLTHALSVLHLTLMCTKKTA